jgi:hypothetical protein
MKHAMHTIHDLLNYFWTKENKVMILHLFYNNSNLSSESCVFLIQLPLMIKWLSRTGAS